MSCHRKYSDEHDQCDIRAVHDGKVRYNTVECKTAVLFFDWLYFLWHGQNSVVTLKYCVNEGEKDTQLKTLE